MDTVYCDEAEGMEKFIEPFFKDLWPALKAAAGSDAACSDADSASATSTAESSEGGSVSTPATPAAPPTADSTAAASGNKRELTIAYASQTGTAKALAKRIFDEATAHGFTSADDGGDTCEMAPLSECKVLSGGGSGAKLLVCVCATTGKGEMPDNGVECEKALLKRKEEGGDQLTSLAGVKFAGTPTTLGHSIFHHAFYDLFVVLVLAMGDTSYVKSYCEAGKQLDGLLADLGGQRVCDIGLTNDNVDMPEDDPDDDDWDTDDEDKYEEERKQLKVKLQGEQREKAVTPWLADLWKSLA